MFDDYVFKTTYHTNYYRFKDRIINMNMIAFVEYEDGNANFYNSKLNEWNSVPCTEEEYQDFLNCVFESKNGDL
jgi:hypothetical protein